MRQSEVIFTSFIFQLPEAILYSTSLYLMCIAPICVHILTNVSLWLWFHAKGCDVINKTIIHMNVTLAISVWFCFLKNSKWGKMLVVQHKKLILRVSFQVVTVVSNGTKQFSEMNSKIFPAIKSFKRKYYMSEYFEKPPGDCISFGFVKSCLTFTNIQIKMSTIHIVIRSLWSYS